VTPALTKAQNEFAVDLFSQLGRSPGNFFFAPYSVATALGMVYAGAGSQTAVELAKTLRLETLTPAPGSNLRATYLQDVAAQPPFGGTEPNGSKFETANALWGENHYDFNPAYIATIKADFGGDLRRVDFADTAGASNEINNWVAAQTHGKIPSIIAPAMLTADTRLILTNAVYFKAAWQIPFDPYDTRRTGFHVTPRDTVQAETMEMTKNLGYAEDAYVQMLMLDYRYSDTSMVIILPKAGQDLSTVESELTISELDALAAARSSALVHVTLPKFSADNTFDMVSALESLGLTRLFDPGLCDLTGIATDPAGPLYVSFVIHKAHLDVDEAGTEAAAATAVGVMVGAVAPGVIDTILKPIQFIADHPFIYFIRDNATGEILFMGRVVDPRH